MRFWTMRYRCCECCKVFDDDRIIGVSNNSSYKSNIYVLYYCDLCYIKEFNWGFFMFRCKKCKCLVMLPVGYADYCYDCIINEMKWGFEQWIILLNQDLNYI